MKIIAILGIILWSCGFFLSVNSGSTDMKSLYDIWGFGPVLLLIALPLVSLYASVKKRKIIALSISIGLLLMTICLLAYRTIMAGYSNKSGDILLFRNYEVIFAEPGWLFLLLGMAFVVFSVYKGTRSAGN